MNKRLTLVLLCSVLSVSVFCQSQISLSSLYNTFSQEENVEKVNIGGLLMFMAKPFVSKYAKDCKISSVKVMSLDECSPEVKLRFNRLADMLQDDKYELLLKSNEKGEKTRIFMRFQNDAVRELVVVSMGDNPALISIKGKIKPEHVQKLMNENNNEQ